MRRALSRIAAVAALATCATLALPAGTAAAASSATCPAAGSTKLFTGGILGSADNKLWVYSPSSTQTIVCFDFYPTLSLGGGAIVVNSTSGVVPPTVTVGSNPAACTAEVVRISDPVPFRIATGASGTTVCLSVNNSTTTLTFGLPGVTTLPSVEIWKDATFSWLAVAACPVQYAMYLASAGPDTCMTTNSRIL